MIFLFTFYALLRKETTRFWSIVGTILVTYSPLMIEHSTVAYTNLSYSVFLILGIMYFWRSLKTDGTRSEASIGFFFVSASLWVRLSEPFWLVGIVLLGFFGYRKKDWLFSIVASLGLLFARRSWSFLVKYIIRGTEIVAENDVQTVVETPKTILQHIQTYVPLHYFAALLVPLSIHFQHIQQVISYLLAYVWPLFNYIFIPWLLITWYDIKKKNFYRLFCINGTIIGILATIFAGTYVFSFFFETWDQIGGSATRMSMFIVPLIWYYLMSSQIWIEIQNTYVKKNRN